MSYTSNTRKKGKDSSEDSKYDTWIYRFIHSPGNEGLLYVPESFFEDRFNLIGLSDVITDIEEAYSVMLDDMYSSEFYGADKLYLMTHQRYILTKAGMEHMMKLIKEGYYGRCKRIGCEKTPLIPIGLSHLPGKSKACLYCNTCNNIYESDKKTFNVDGCAFGRTFPHLLILTYPQYFPTIQHGTYIPRIFGFKIGKEED
ncbi:Casein kinase II subunit beta [Astathelohania contejeani]|uniref:Casein kinase II subunit beta n=1 Tax=Astathelohania contejeani TaxID=164912 RepID=A0ABQ7I0Q2_9MICR|nr:Casein kinase II subunit beta [Thelohania contejeani]